jgi:ADP-heptose:LPS heptosyltransferase
MLSKAKAHSALALVKVANAIIFLWRLILWIPHWRAEVRVIVVHRVGQIGDTLCALPAIYSIRKRFPLAKIILLTSAGPHAAAGAIDFYSLIPWINHIETYDSGRTGGLAAILRIMRCLRANKIDLWVSLPQDRTNLRTELRNMIFAKLIGAKMAVGFSVRTYRVFLKDQEKHLSFISERNFLLELVINNKVGDSDFGNGIELAKDAFNRFGSRSIFQRFVDDKPLLAVAPGAKRSMNRWPRTNFVNVAKRWVVLGGKVVVIGGHEDISVGEEIVSSCGRSAMNFCGQTSIQETLVILERSVVALTNDSGPMHLADAIGTPCVVAFSARDFPNRWYPTGDKHKIIRKSTCCSPCLAEVCNNGLICIESISVDDVWEELKLFFGIPR